MALKLSDVKKNSNKKKFNTVEALRDVLSEEKVDILLHNAKHNVIIGAKDTGKTFPVKAYEYYTMETDPMASTLDLRKYSTGAAKRLGRSFMSFVNLAKSLNYESSRGKEKMVYEQSQSFMFRTKEKGRRNNLECQSQEYASFEDVNGLAGIQVGNGGYYSVVHVEEPAMQDDVNPTERKEWNANMKTIIDSVERSTRSYLATKPYHPPFKLKIFYTLNDWDEGHPLSEDAQLYFPRERFLDWVLGISYSKILKRFEGQQDGEPIFELKEIIDKNWKEIKRSVVKNHTKTVYVDKNKYGKIVDTTFTRMQKFANPEVLLFEDAVEEIFNDMYFALITGDSLELARVFGMSYDGSSTTVTTHNFKNLEGKDTKKILSENGRDLLGFSLGWDIDVNRRLVATPITLSAVKYNVGDPFNPEYAYKDWKVMIHSQQEAPGYGRGSQYSPIYIESMKELSKQIVSEYTGNRKLMYGTGMYVDDDRSTWIPKINVGDIQHLFDFVSEATKQGKDVTRGGFDILIRQQLWDIGIDTDAILIDESNESLIKFLNKVPRGDNGKRIEKGIWEKLADYVNSAEYGLYPFALNIMLPEL